MGALFGPLITWFLGTVVRREVEAEILRKKKAKKKKAAEKKKDAAARKKHAAKQAERVATIKRLQAERLQAEQEEYEREEKSKKVQKDLKKRIEALQVPGDYADDY